MSPLRWEFPLPRCHTGIPIGNGIQGLLVWGSDTLRITVSRAGFWHHREGRAFRADSKYSEVKRLVGLRDEEALRHLFVSGGGHPFQIGGGRLEIKLPDQFRPVCGMLHLAEGKVEIVWENPAGETLSLWICQARDAECAWIEGLPETAQIELFAAWDFLEEKLAALGIGAPGRWLTGDGGGFLQSLPGDAPLALAWRRTGGQITIQTALGEAARSRVCDPVERVSSLEKSRAWWTQYWADVPVLELPDPELQHAYLLGLHKQAGLTPCGGLAATLQGPWMEEDRLPPWSNDYHFNVNVQLVYGPALPSNRPDHLWPLWDMLRGWFPTLSDNGKKFFGRPGAMLLPHAVDDRCQVIGSFWAGTIDHACTAWMAQLAWQHYRYAMDENVLREIAWPLLNGAFEGYWAMMERVDEAGGGWRFSLPLSVSPEYNGSSLDACGRDASFQLAACHSITRILSQASRLLGEPEDSRWAEVGAHLPSYTTIGSDARIALWENQDLDESHRHHSHLAAIWPFATVDPFADEHWKTVGSSLRHWGVKGAGRWTGWCLPWASILCGRCGLPDAAVAWLKWGQMLFTDVGHGTLHDPDFAGAGGSWSDGILDRPGFLRGEEFPEIMQMDAAMATVTAILELCLQSRGDTIHVLERLPKHWREFRFDGIRAEGAFLVGAEVRRGLVQKITVHSEKGGLLRIRHPLPDGMRLRRGDRVATLSGKFLETETHPGEDLLLSRG
ncbi:MAG: glycoside hydrolase family 95-like protein [Verrucomicrobiota bacterium]